MSRIPHVAARFQARLRSLIPVLVGIATVLCVVSSADAGVTATQRCAAAKMKAAGKYAACRLTADAKAESSGLPADYSKCDLRQSASFAAADLKYGAACPTSGDQAAQQLQTAQDTAAVTAELIGAPLCGNGNIDPEEECDGANLGGQSCTGLGYASGTLTCSASCELDPSGCRMFTCGNGIAETGEACDGTDLRNQTCQSQGFLAGTLACDGSCALDTSGCTNTRFVDNGDGTVTDNQTGLQWEQKVAGSSCLHCVNDTYTWGTGSGSADGTAFTSFLGRLVALCTSTSFSQTITGGFGGHCDWRLPTLGELLSIRDLSQGACGGGSGACIDPIFGPTATTEYWSSITDPRVGSGPFVYQVDFGSSTLVSGNETPPFAVRAVRGGS